MKRYETQGDNLNQSVMVEKGKRLDESRTGVPNLQIDIDDTLDNEPFNYDVDDMPEGRFHRTNTQH